MTFSYYQILERKGSCYCVLEFQLCNFRCEYNETKVFLIFPNLNHYVMVYDESEALVTNGQMDQK